MPQLNDILKSTLVYEVEGVTCRNDLYHLVTVPGTIANLSAVAAVVLNDFIAATNGVLTTEVKYTACLVDNQTRNEVRGIATSVTVGSNVGSCHPQDQVLRFNEYGNNAPGLPLLRGAFNLSGIAEEYSSTGRLNDETPFFPMLSFLLNAITNTPAGFTMVPQVRTWITGSLPRLYNYWTVQAVRVNATFFKLKSRKANILGV